MPRKGKATQIIRCRRGPGATTSPPQPSSLQVKKKKKNPSSLQVAREESSCPGPLHATFSRPVLHCGAELRRALRTTANGRRGGAGGAGFPWLHRLRATVDYNSRSRSRRSPAKHALNLQWRMLVSWCESCCVSSSVVRERCFGTVSVSWYSQQLFIIAFNISRTTMIWSLV